MNQVSHFKVAVSFMSNLMLGGLALGSLVSVALAQERESKSVIEEVLVTAQRSEQGIQDVPIAVTALSGAMLEERQIINPSDLQLNTPNVTFTATNFGNSSTSIRGIGRLVISTSGESGVSNHINEIPITSNQNAIEFFDVERVEILRGPQGTLFGRNATGGAVNIVTKMPDLEAGLSGFVDAEIGDFNNVRFKGALNLPLSDKLAVRFAGFDLKRDGYIKNLAYNQPGVDNAGDPTGETLPDIKPTVDGRNLSAFRITGLWDIADNASAWIQYNNFRENDDRARITNQICTQTPLATTGCDPNEAGFETPHLASNTGNLFAIFNGALPPLAGGQTIPAGPLPFPAGPLPLTYNYPRPVTLGLRTMHTDFQPIFQAKEENFLFGMDIELGPIDIGILSAYQETESFTRQDYNMDVGPSLAPVPAVVAVPADPATMTPAIPASPGNPSGNYPTAQIPLGILGDLTGPCALVDPTNAGLGRAGAGRAHREGGGQAAGAAPVTDPCIHPSNQNRVFSYDQANGATQYWTAEVTAASNFDGSLNFNAGVSTYRNKVKGDYYVVANTLDLAEYVGVGGNRLYTGYFNSRTNLLDQDGYALFGEVYFDLTDSMKITAGVRYNQDTKDILDSGVLANSAFVPLPSALGGPRYIRAGVAGFLATTEMPDGPSAMAAATNLAARDAAITDALGPRETPNGRLLARYNTQEAIMAAQAALASPAAATLGAGALVGLLSAVPIVPEPGETRDINLSETNRTWKEITGRVGIDWNITNDNLVYGFYSRGYKPGGFNPNVPQELRTEGSPFQQTFGAEEVDAFEVGSKNTFLEGKMTLNATAFIYDYKGLQVTRIVNNTSLNENIDADISGVELELVWVPLANLTVDLAYSYLDSKIRQGSASVDPIGRTVGDTENNWRILTDVGGATTGVNYIAHIDALTQVVLANIPAAAKPFSTFGVPGTFYPAEGTLPDIPVHLSRAALTAVVKAVGVATDETIGNFVSDGLETQLGGNELPNSPKHTIHLGAAWRQNVEAIRGSLTFRWDVYWQGESFARDFNTLGDKIDAWQQHNLSLTYNSSDGVIQGRLWVRNLLDDDNVTGKYLTSDTSGLYRNYFLTEPRIFGASIRYNFGL